MKIHHMKDPFFHIIVEEAFSDLDSIFDELDSLKDSLLSPEHTGGSKSESGEIEKKNKGLFLDGCQNYQKSKIVSGTNKLLTEIINSKKWENHVFHRMFGCTSWTGYLVSHYECGDYYLPHYDDGLFTLITFIFDDYENRIGGDLYFPEHDYLHKCKNNQSILFLSKEMHQVTTFESKSNRYSISTFSHFQKPNKEPLNNKSLDLPKLIYN